MARRESGRCRAGGWRRGRYPFGAARPEAPWRSGPGCASCAASATTPPISEVGRSCRLAATSAGANGFRGGSEDPIWLDARFPSRIVVLDETGALVLRSQAKGSYRFGEFELDLDAFLLRRGDEPLALQPKALEVLRYLIEHRERMVSKTELLEQLWPDDNVGRAVVSWSVSHIRRALGQRGRDGVPIETVHGRGYRFLADVEEAQARETLRRGPAPAVDPATALVGRDQVMTELFRHVELAAGGRGSLCVVTGEAGIGKTRCGAELVARAPDLGLAPLSGRWSQEVGAPPLWPVLSALGQLGAEHAEIVASARKQMSETAVARPVSDGDRFWRIEHAARLLRELAAQRPLLLFLDDLHWADAESLRLLAFIAPELPKLSLCIVTTLRRDDQDPGAHDAGHLPVLRHASLVPLSSLDRAQVADLVCALTECVPSPELAEAVRRAAGGIPLFVQEVIRSLVLEHGQEALGDLPPERVRVPALARDLLRHRIRRLPADTVDLLRRAAVMGESFELTLLAALLELEPEVLLDRLEPARLGGQLQSEAPHSYRFVHSLFRTVLYEDMPPGQRMAVHRKIAQLLAGRPEEAASKGVIARHYYLSLPLGAATEVARRAREAGEQAMCVFAFEDASVYFEWALEALVSGSAAPGARAELLLSLAAAQRSAGRTGDAMKTIEQLLEIAKQHQRYDLVVRATRLRRVTVALASVPDAIARAALEAVIKEVRDESDPAHISALAQLSYLPPYESDLGRSKELSARALALAEQRPDREGQFEALGARLFSLSGPDDTQAALEVAERTLALDEELGGSWKGGDARVARFSTYLLLGRIPEADAMIADMASAISGPHWGEAKFFCERLQAQRAFLDGRFDESEARWNKAYDGAVRAGVAYAGMFRRAQKLFLALEREGPTAVAKRVFSDGRPQRQFLPAFRAGLARIAAEAGELALVRMELTALGDPAGYPRDGAYLNLLACFSVCAAALRDRARCEQLFGLLEPYAKFNTPDAMGFYLGSVSYFLGLLSVALGRTVEAGPLFEDAVEHNLAMGYRVGVVRALLAHASLERRRGQPSRALLGRALSEAQQIGMARVVRDLEAAIADS